MDGVVDVLGLAPSAPQESVSQPVTAASAPRTEEAVPPSDVSVSEGKGEHVDRTA